MIRHKHIKVPETSKVFYQIKELVRVFLPKEEKIFDEKGSQYSFLPHASNDMVTYNSNSSEVLNSIDKLTTNKPQIAIKSLRERKDSVFTNDSVFFNFTYFRVQLKHQLF